MEIMDFADEQVTLRPLVEADIPGLIRIVEDAEVSRWIPDLPNPYTEADARDFYIRANQTLEAGNFEAFAVTRTQDGTFLGMVNLHHFRAQTTEMGINLESWIRGTGASIAACKQLINYAFEQLGLDYIYWRTLVPHWASRKLAWKLGFRFEAELRGFLENRGKSEPEWFLSLARGEALEPCEPWAGPEKD